MKTQQGFTLIELIVVIIILGILSATALPKFVDLTGDAEQSVADSVAGSVSSWGMANYAAAKLNKTSAKLIDGADACQATANSLSAAASVILSGDISLVPTSDTTTSDPQKYRIYKDSDATDSCSAGATVTCKITNTKNTTKSALVYVPCTTN